MRFLCLLLFFSSALLAADTIWIDVRTANEYNSRHVSEAENIPYIEIAGGLSASYFPMQKLAKISPNNSSARTSPVISPRAF